MKVYFLLASLAISLLFAISFGTHYLGYSQLYLNTAIRLRQSMRDVIMNQSVDFTNVHDVVSSINQLMKDSSFRNENIEVQLLGIHNYPRMLSINIVLETNFLKSQSIEIRETIIEVEDV